MLRGRGVRRGGGRRAAGAPGSHLRAPPAPPPARPPGQRGSPVAATLAPAWGGAAISAPRGRNPSVSPVSERPPGLGSQPRPSAAGPGWASPLQAEAATASSQNSAGVALRVSPASPIRTGLSHFLPERGAVLRAPTVRRSPEPAWPRRAGLPCVCSSRGLEGVEREAPGGAGRVRGPPGPLLPGHPSSHRLAQRPPQKWDGSLLGQGQWGPAPWRNKSLCLSAG